MPDLAALERRFVYRDFGHFLRTWLWKSRFLCELDDFTFFAEAVARDLAAQNIVYVEAFYSPPEYARFGLSVQEVTVALRKGLDRVPEVQVMLVADLVRDLGPFLARRTLAQVDEVRDQGVIGIGIGGREYLFPAGLFTGVYAEARRRGFHTTAHAGEAAGASSVWAAVRKLQVERIGHGTRAVEDPALLDALAERQIPVEMCPLSNVRTGVVASIEAHPIRQFFDRGLLVTVNTDDPKMFGNSLEMEYRLLQEVHGFTWAEIVQLHQNAIQGSWAGAERKSQLLDQLATAARQPSSSSPAAG